MLYSNMLQVYSSWTFFFSSQIAIRHSASSMPGLKTVGVTFLIGTIILDRKKRLTVYLLVNSVYNVHVQKN